MRVISLIFFVSIAAGMGLGPAYAQQRVALVIGNSAYQHTSPLANPSNDAADIITGLKHLGFEVVAGLDLDKPSFDKKVQAFAERLSGATAAVFFYAGHGLQVAGQNYLVPVDAKLSTAAALDWEMVRLDLVQRTMEREAPTNIIFLDACRDNPLARNLARAMGTRSADIGRGLAASEAGVGTLISFSTQPGNVALDGVGRNSPFAHALLRHLAAPEDLSAILIDVRNDVRKATQNKQVPWEHSALTGRFYFSPAASTSPSGQPSTAYQLSEAADLWSHTKDTTDLQLLEAFASRFKDSLYARLAEARIRELNKQASLPAAKPKPKTASRGLFEGEWRITAQSRDCPLKTFTQTLTVTDKEITGWGGKFKGQVAEDGTFRFTSPGHANPSMTGTYIGKLQGNDGRGTYAFTGCSGTLTLSKIN